MLDVLCGILLLAVGYWLGQRKKTTVKSQLSEDQIKAEKKQLEQWEMLMSFSGKGNGNG